MCKKKIQGDMYKSIFVIKLKSYSPLLLNEAASSSHGRKLESSSLFIQKLVRDPLKFYGFCVICVEKEVNIQMKQELRRKKKREIKEREFR